MIKIWQQKPSSPPLTVMKELFPTESFLLGINNNMFVEIKKIGILAKAWESWLFHSVYKPFGNICNQKKKNLPDAVIESGIPMASVFETVFDADFEETSVPGRTLEVMLDLSSKRRILSR
jgi:hypothetical protein